MVCVSKLIGERVCVSRVTEQVEMLACVCVTEQLEMLACVVHMSVYVCVCVNFTFYFVLRHINTSPASRR